MNLNELQRIHGMWADAAFGKGRDGSGSFAHMLREVRELTDAEAGIRRVGVTPELREEVAAEAVDVMMLLLDWLRLIGVIDLEERMLRKLETNMNRRWGPMLPDGSYEHVRD